MLGFRVVTLPGGLLLAALVLLAGSPTASADTIVVPAPASAEGDTNNSHPFDLVDPFPLAYQQVYGSAEFGVEALWITGIAFRPDAETGRAFSATLPDVAIHLSTTAASPDNLSDILNDNRGVDEVLVRTGPLLLSSRYIGPTDGPKEFDIAIPFTTPFFYDPRAATCSCSWLTPAALK